MRSPSSVYATTLGVVRLPSAFGITFTSSPSITATQLLVVPRSMPTIRDLPIGGLLAVPGSARGTGGSGARDHHARRSDQPFAHAIAALELADHRAGRMVGGIDLLQRV